jgi:transcription initiation factor TFIIIB Brf1 subunit/transcription initiation factor TFIIB
MSEETYLQKKKAFADSIANVLSSTDNQITKLEERNQLYSLKLKTDLVDQQVQSQKKELTKRTLVGKLLGLLTLIAVLIVLILRNKNAEVKEVIEKINNQNKEIQNSIQKLHKTQHEKLQLEEKNRQYIAALKTYEQIKPSLDFLKISLENLQNIPEKKEKKIDEAFDQLNETILKYKNAVEIVRVKYTEQEEMLKIK